MDKPYTYKPGVTGVDVFRANIGRAAHGTRVMECGVYSSVDNARLALRKLLPKAQAEAARSGRTVSEADFDIEADTVDLLLT